MNSSTRSAGISRAELRSLPQEYRFKVAGQYYKARVIAGKLPDLLPHQLAFKYPEETGARLDSLDRTIIVGSRYDGTLLMPAIGRMVATAWANEVATVTGIRCEYNLGNIVLRPSISEKGDRRFPTYGSWHRWDLWNLLDPKFVGVFAATVDCIKVFNELLGMVFSKRASTDPHHRMTASTFGPLNPATRKPAWAKLPIPPVEIVKSRGGLMRCPHCKATFKYKSPLLRHIEDHGDGTARLRGIEGGIKLIGEGGVK